MVFSPCILASPRLHALPAPHLRPGFARINKINKSACVYGYLKLLIARDSIASSLTHFVRYIDQRKLQNVSFKANQARSVIRMTWELAGGDGKENNCKEKDC